MSEENRTSSSERRTSSSSGDDGLLGRRGCEVCKGLGYVRPQVALVGSREFGKLVPCECRAEALADHERRKLERISGLTDEQLAIRFDDLLDRSDGVLEMKREADRFAEGKLAMLTFAGPPGVGKTTALHACVNESRERRGTVGSYIALARLLDHVREGYTENAEKGARDRYDEWVAAPLIAVDEIDKIKWTDWAREQWTRFLDERYQAAEEGRSQTAFAMNKRPRDFLSSWDCDRLERYPVVFVEDPSMREVQRILDEEMDRKDMNG